MSAGRLSHLKSSLQLMVTGLTGRTGAIVLSRVAAECRIDQERAPIPRRLLAESRVLERVTKHELAMKILAQVTLALTIQIDSCD